MGFVYALLWIVKVGSALHVAAIVRLSYPLQGQLEIQKMNDFFQMDIPVVRVPRFNFEDSLSNAVPEVLQEQHGNIYPSESLPIRPGKRFQPTRDLLSVLPK